MFAIGHGIPPNGPLRAIRLAATPLSAQIANYLTTTTKGQQWHYSPQSGSSTAV
jgi:putative flavoprotein involved in K+ transport